MCCRHMITNSPGVERDRLLTYPHALRQVVRAEIRDCRCLALQKRKRDPAVVAMLLRSRKPLASPPLSEVDMTPR